MLKQAHRGIEVNEDTLLDRQNIAIDNPYLKATSYRNEQNYLGTAQSGALGVTYVPPEFHLARELMDCLCELANDPPTGVHPLILASVVSFGFVFIHPFMDGNGRLSRFLFHQVLCKTGALSDGLVLPVSTVMHQNEGDYLEALKSFSEQIPEFWEIWPTSDVEMAFDFKGHEALYRYWDGTRCCEFMAQCAETAIEQHLKEETIYLNRYDAIYRRINDRFDVASKDLANLVMFCMEQRGQLSNRRRKQYLYRVEEDVFDELELAYQEVVGNDPSATTDQVSDP
ncbi:Fic family protein [Tamilnaduibacter salinus]|uniref:Fic family protein n=1 Tax=Tamilnaduibacter salinus TaxID=1484056 RepID=UPI001B8052CB|nr:Fic family protein [Tamilnaduibacter salinus]